MHESAVYVSVEQIGHGEDRAVTEGGQAARHASLPAPNSLALVLDLTAVVQQVHKECEIPANNRCKQQLT